MPNDAEDKAAWLRAAMAKVTAEPRYLVGSHPINESVPTILAGGGSREYYAERSGVSVYVFDNQSRKKYGQICWRKDVWQRGLMVNFRPFYNRRLARAIQKAEKVAKELESGRRARSLYWW